MTLSREIVVNFSCIHHCSPWSFIRWYNVNYKGEYLISRYKEGGVLKLRQGIVQLYKKVATSLPPDVEEALRAAHEQEAAGSPAASMLEEILAGIKTSRSQKRPICLESGIPMFYISVPPGIGHRAIEDDVREATREATVKIPLSPSAVDPITNENSGDNTGEGFPLVYFEETDSSSLSIELILKPSWSDNEGHTWLLPDSSIGAGADLDGVRKCIVETVRRTGGRGCPPYIIGVGIGATRAQVAALSQRQLRRKVNNSNPIEKLAALEGQVLDEVNALGIGPSGHGGKTTALGVKIGANHRHPDSFFVDVALSCWSTRRGKLIW